jgi:hypothetical protein
LVQKSGSHPARRSSAAYERQEQARPLARGVTCDHASSRPIGPNAFWQERGAPGGGTGMLLDTGTWEPTGDAEPGLKKARLDFELHGKCPRGRGILG